MFVLDQDTSECLHYEPVTGYPPKSIARIPRDILESHPNIEIRNDLLDCSIDVCALEARPPLFYVFLPLTNSPFRYRRYFKTTLIMVISGGILCTAYSRQICS